MVDPILAILSLCVGFLAYLLPALVGDLLPTGLQTRLGRVYFDLSKRSYGHCAFVRRQLGGIDIKPMSMHDSRPTAEVTLSGGMIGEDRTIEFGDPDNRIKRWGKKKVAVVPEVIPAAVDPEMSEVGHWIAEKKHNEDLERNGKVDPYVGLSDTARIADPMDVIKITSKSTDTDDIGYVESMTKRRFAKYDDGVGAMEAMSTIFGFGAGVGGVAALMYVNSEVIGGGGGGGGEPTAPIPMAIDIMVTLL